MAWSRSKRLLQSAGAMGAIFLCAPILFLLVAADGAVFIAEGLWNFVRNARILRFILVFPVIFPLFMVGSIFFIIEEILAIRKGPAFFLDRYLLDPMNNFIDTGVFKCS